MIFGVFFIIIPELNYYSKLNTVVYVVVILGGLYSYHRKTESPSEYQPYVSVIIPVYNGEKDIYSVIKSHVQSNYPKDKLEIIIANDGSYDNTVHEIRRAIMDFPDTYVKHLPYSKNDGKRKVIRKALSETTGEIIVRCDADTYVRKDSIGKLVSHLKDGRVGGVTGRTYVKNKDNNIITKMQYVRYNYGFQQLYPFHNLLGSVFCLPGCFSAYNRKAIEEIIDDWASTKPSLSEDRHLCHMLLENGYSPKYVKDAACDTVVPNTLKGYVNQQTRWAKANAVQQLRSTTVMYKINKRLFLMYLVTYFISATTPYAILRLIILPHAWSTWIIIVTLASLGRGLIVEGFSINALYAIPLFYFHLLLDLWKTPLGMLTINEKT
jgi:hyaluronan synthase